MPTWAKVLVIVGVLLVLLIVAVVGLGVYIWKQNGPQFIENTRKAADEGRAFGRGTDNQACLVEGVSRHKRAEGFGELISTGIFLRGCLEASERTPGFCDGVPGQTEFIKSAQWQKEQCLKYGLSEAKQCGQLFVQVQQYCASPQRQPTPLETQ